MRARPSFVRRTVIFWRWKESFRHKASAESRDLFGNDKMRFVRTSKVGTDPFSKLLSSKQSIVLNRIAFAMHPFGLNRIEPGALRGQQEGQDTHPFACLLHLLIVFSDPGADQEAFMPGGIIPDQEPVALALRGQTLTTPVQEPYRDRTHRTTGDKAQPHVVPLRIVWGPFLPQLAIAGQCLGIGISLLPGLFNQTHRMV